MFLHSVYFWLANPTSAPDQAALLTGLESLRGVEAIQQVQIGEPGPTRRPVIEHTYSVALLLTFANQTDHDTYQNHPIHLEFVAQCAHLWSRVQIYDIVTD